MIAHKSRLAVIVTMVIGAGAVAGNIPEGFVVPKCTISPDGRYGVTVPILDQHDDSENPRNSVIELRTGRILAVIETKWTGWNRMNRGGVLPCRWSPDSSLLLWEVDGRFFRDAVVLLKFKQGKLQRQFDITHIAQQEILHWTHQAQPIRYRAARKANAGDGEAYPDKFSIQVDVKNPIELPLKLRATLTSNPKAIDYLNTLESTLAGLIDGAGGLTVTAFEVAPGLWEKYVDEMDTVQPCDSAQFF